MLQSYEGTRNFNLAVTSTGIEIIKRSKLEDELAIHGQDHKRLTKQILANEKLFEPKRIYSEGINLNKTFYKGKAFS